MSKKLLYLFGILATILIGTWLYVNFCCNCCTVECITVEENKNGNTKSKSETTSTPLIKTNGFSFSLPNLNYNCNDNFNFSSSNFNLLLPVSDSIELGISKLKAALEKNNSKFKVTGFYKSDEKNNSIFPNLGLARANAVKNYLVQKGILENNIEISDELHEDLIVKNDTLFGPVYFGWLKEDIVASEGKDWNAAKRTINATPLTLYFDTGQSTISLTQSQKQKIAAIVEYVNHVEGSKISITGHTDNNPGVRHTNQYYSEERAAFVKKYFVSNGIPVAKIEASGKGEIQPIADNSTEEGRAKNRRTEIIVK